MKKILCMFALIVALICVVASCNKSPEISISEDGYWVINGEKTDVKAQGEQGIQGEKGDKGDKGDSATATDENPLGLAFFLKDDGTYAVEIGQAKYLSKIEIPATYKGKAVTEVGSFGSEILKEITIPNSVTSIDSYAFYSCTSLTSVTIGDSVTSIGNYAFYDCTSLTSVTIPDSVTNIDPSAFYACGALTSIFVDNDNTVYQSIDGNLYSKDGKTLIAYAIGKNDTSFAIPNSVTIIGDYAFSNCNFLASVTIPDSVTNIGPSAFYDCSSLTSITIPDSVTSIGDSAFRDCTALTSITIPNSVTSIGYKTFAFCSALTSITIPDSVTSIGDSAFEFCNNLTDVYYTGREADWAQITIGDSNYWYLTNATIHYNYTTEE